MLSAEVGVEHEPASQHWLAEKFLSKKVTPQLLWLSFLQDTYILMQGYDHGEDFHVYFNLFLNTLKMERVRDRERARKREWKIDLYYVYTLYLLKYSCVCLYESSKSVSEW